MLSFDTTIGPLTVTASEKGITNVSFGDSTCENVSPLEEQARQEIDEYLAGTRKHFTVPLDPPATTAFRQRVWEAVASISYGETKTYSELGAARAVGTACARNPLPILVPCHRVVAKNGLGGYLGGLPIKQHLLELERLHWRS